MTTTTARPGANQVRILTALRDAETTFTIRDGGIAPGLASKAQVATLIEKGWADPSGDTLTLSPAGEAVLAEAEARAAYREHSRDHGGNMSITVVKRSRGVNHRALGGGRAPAGRNVRCSDCYRTAVAKREAGETRVTAEPVVWFTNESGAAAQRKAEVAAGKHILRHLTGDLASA